MSPPPVVPLPAAWEFFERKRRLAYYLAWASMGLLAVELSLGSALELYGHPRAVAAEGGFWLAHHAPSRDEPDGSQMLFLEPDLKPRGEPLQLVDPITALLPEGKNVTVFYGSRGSVLSEGQSSQSLDLGQTWDVLSAVEDPGRRTAWIFGWNDGKVVARRRENGAWSPEIPVLPSGMVDRLSASMDGASGPFVAWRERSSTRVRTALFDGTAFAPRAEFEIADAQQWDAVRAGGRTLFTLYNREDRSLRAVTLRLQCCEDCRSPLPPRKIAFADPVLLLARRVTGLSTLVSGNRLYIFITRPATLAWAAVQASTLEPEQPAPRLTTIPLDSPWLALISAVTPTLLVFCSLALIFLGYILFRERNRILSGGPAQAPDENSGLLLRTMAYILDLVVLMPLFVAVTEYVDVPVDDLNDPRLFWILGIWLVLEFTYHFILEWRLGWTIGKWILGIRVAELDGSPLTFRGAFLRNLLRAVDGQFPFGVILGVGLMLRTKRGQRLGDLAARTVVIRDPGRRRLS